MTIDGPSRMLAWLRNSGQSPPNETEGPILWADNQFADEIDANGLFDVSDTDVPSPVDRGLMMFEGWIEMTPGPDPDVHWHGEWRRLEFHELANLRFGKGPSGEWLPRYVNPREAAIEMDGVK